MIEQGLIDEVRRLMADPQAHPTAVQAIGYKEIAAALRGDVPMDEAVRMMKQATRRFAKRQMTWFRGMERRGTPINWLPYDLSNDDFVAAVLDLKAKMQS